MISSRPNSIFHSAFRKAKTSLSALILLRLKRLFTLFLTLVSTLFVREMARAQSKSGVQFFASEISCDEFGFQNCIVQVICLL